MKKKKHERGVINFIREKDGKRAESKSKTFWK